VVFAPPSPLGVAIQNKFRSGLGKFKKPLKVLLRAQSRVREYWSTVTRENRSSGNSRRRSAVAHRSQMTSRLDRIASPVVTSPHPLLLFGGVCSEPADRYAGRGGLCYPALASDGEPADGSNQPVSGHSPGLVFDAGAPIADDARCS
jgi:hypothetical protein